MVQKKIESLRSLWKETDLLNWTLGMMTRSRFEPQQRGEIIEGSLDLSINTPSIKEAGC
jgi:hypothetical protein